MKSQTQTLVAAGRRALARAVRAGVGATVGSRRRPVRVLSGLCRGMRMWFSPHGDPFAWVLGRWEPDIQCVLARWVRAGDCCWDVGAHVGTHTLALSRLVGPRGAVHAVEPGSANADLLRRNVDLNRRANVRVHQIAAGGSNGVGRLRIPRGGPSMSSLVWHRDDAEAQVERVEIRRLDDLVEAGELPPPAFVKIDVEGSDGAVLEGAELTLRRYRPIIVVEVSEIGRGTTWRLLQSIGYRVHRVAPTLLPIDDFAAFRHMDAIALPVPGLAATA